MAPNSAKPPEPEMPKHVTCETLHGEPFFSNLDVQSSFDWWEVCCFPYTLLMKLWDCCMSLCNGTNQCIVYWLMVQWLVCKISQFTTPDPILYPYYFYAFGQVFGLTALFIYLWYLIGDSAVIPYFQAMWKALLGLDDESLPPSGLPQRLTLRKYCFRKSEIFDVSSFDQTNAADLVSCPVVLVYVTAGALLGQMAF